MGPDFYRGDCWNVLCLADPKKKGHVVQEEIVIMKCPSAMTQTNETRG
jgi:hypothetical protein